MVRTGRPPTPVVDGRKRCSRCGQTKALDQFYVTKGRVQAWCKECYKIDGAERWANNPDKQGNARRRWLWSKFRTTPEDYDRRLAEQGGRCKICPATEPGGGRAYFCVDHDHRCCPGRETCGQCVRGLLCWSCNSGLGSFGDDPARLRAAADYLEVPHD